MKQFCCICLVFVMFISVCPAINAQGGAFVIMDGRTGQVLEGENRNTPLPMASTTKVMTALVVLERVPLQAKVVITAESVGIEGSSLYIKTGEVYTVEELLYGLLLQSANDCAVALAIFTAGSVDAFVGLMNERAVQMGLKQTCFKNPNGLSAPGHCTTATELAQLMAKAMENGEFCKIIGTKRYKVQEKTIVNHNKLLTLYPDCIGGKTGYTIEAGRCLVSVAQRSGVALICVTLNRRDDWNIHTTAYETWFDQMQSVALAKKGEVTAQLTVAGGGSVGVCNADEVSAIAFSPFDGVEQIIKAPAFIYGNKQTGAVVGTVEFWYKGVKIAESPLVLTAPIETVVKKELFITRIFRFFRRIFLKKD